MKKLITGLLLQCFFLLDFAMGENPPNVIVILTDDQGWGDLSVNGNSLVHTPTIDHLAEEGVTLNQFYVSPLCAPTRASLLTGKYHLKVGTRWVSNGLENFHPNAFTLGDMFQQAGYATGCFGKWHNGAHWPNHPNAKGFDEFVGFCAGHIGEYNSPTLEKNGQEYQTKGYITDVLTDEAIDFIKRNKENQFFCFLPYNVPHSPFVVPDEYYDKTYARLTHMEGKKERNKDACVYAMMENLDDNLNRLFRELEDNNLANNTIIIYMSDNGPNGVRYNGDLRGKKNSVYEGGVRVPFYIKWPEKIGGGQVVNQPTAHIDVLPTLATLCNIPVSEDLNIDGVDLSGLIIGKSKYLPERNIYVQNSRKQLMPYKGGFRNNQYRIGFHDKNRIELYDIIADPEQIHDLSKEKPEIFEAMVRDYMDWFNEAKRAYIPADVISIGYEQWPLVVLNAHESKFSGHPRFYGENGFAHDWITNWTSTSDSIYWEVDVVQDVSYNVDIKYTCTKASVGSEIKVASGKTFAINSIRKEFDPPQIDSGERYPRLGVNEKSWASLKLGKINLKKGKQRIVLTAPKVNGNEVAEVKAIVLKNIK